MGMKTFTQTEMDMHKNSFSDWASKKYRCFCKDKKEDFTMSYNEISKHLKTECPMVRIQCHQCHQDQALEESSFSRAEFKTHKCHTDLHALQEKLKSDKDFMIAQVVQI